MILYLIRLLSASKKKTVKNSRDLVETKYELDILKDKCTNPLHKRGWYKKYEQFFVIIDSNVSGLF